MGTRLGVEFGFACDITWQNREFWGSSFADNKYLVDKIAIKMVVYEIHVSFLLS